MKKSIFIFALICQFLLIACATCNQIDKVYIGQSLEEFNKNFTKKALIEMRDNTIIYRADAIFFYFEDKKLVKMDRGERAVDARIKIDIN